MATAHQTLVEDFRVLIDSLTPQWKMLSRLGESTSKTIFILDLQNQSLELRRPLGISIEQTETGWYAFSYDLDELVVGADENEILSEMRLAIADVYYLLKAEAEHLGHIQKQHWDFLQSVVSEAP